MSKYILRLTGSSGSGWRGFGSNRERSTNCLVRGILIWNIAPMRGWVWVLDLPAAWTRE